MKIVKLKVNQLTNPIGYDFTNLNITYKVIETKATKQIAGQIIIAIDEEFNNCVYDSGLSQEVNNLYNHIDIQLKPRTRYYYKIKAVSNLNEEAISEVAFFETGKMEEGWVADFITPQMNRKIHPILSKSFVVNKDCKKARFYGLGLGLYELYLNGRKVSEEYLLPGLHAYDSWLQYQTFELEVEEGENLLEVHLGDGWYKGPFGLKSLLPRYGEEYAFIGEVVITYNKEEVLIKSDNTWTARKDKVVFDSIYDGEIYDDTIQDKECYPVEIIALDKRKLSERLSPQIIINERITPIEIITTPKNEIVLDFGQNLVGWVEFKVKEAFGSKITLSYSEILQDGCFYRDNLRKAKCEYTYISNGEEKIVRPHYTFYGFRYVKVEGIKEEINANDFTAMVIHSKMEEVGKIETSNYLVNKLLSNIKWGQKGNFLDIPTDCPQRDERMGWTGDAQIFADTATYTMDTYAFYVKFMKDLKFEQDRLGGSVPYVVPMSKYELHGATTWGDAATVIPWSVYLHSGDITILKNQYKSMRGWVEYIRGEANKTSNPRLWLNGKHFGDWLALDGKVDGGVYGSTNKFFIASAFYYYSTEILAKTAELLHNEEDAIKYKKMSEEIKEAFIKEYFSTNGKLCVDTQTAYAIVIYMDLYREEFKARIVADFKEKMKDNNFKLNTGFVGTPYLCQALSKCGLDEIAYGLLLNEEYPGWLYEVKMGATTIWERWNSVLPDGKISGTGMNSLNHYAYGSIASWIYRYVIGISPVEENPGFKKALIAPKPSYHLDFAKCELDTLGGTYKVEWQLKETRILKINIEIPFDSVATVILPRAKDTVIKLEGYEQCNWIETNREDLMCELTSGIYVAEYTPNKSYKKKLTLDCNFNEVMSNDNAKEIVLKYFPNALKGIPFQGEATILDEILHSPFAEVSEENIAKLEKELGDL